MMHELGRVVDFEGTIQVTYELEEKLNDVDIEFLQNKMSELGYGVSNYKQKFTIKERIVGRIPGVQDKDLMLSTFKSIIIHLKGMNKDLAKME